MPPGKQMSRFPAARIKKILQADEEVGRVNQATLPVVGVAVELFIESLVNAAAGVLPEGVTTLTPTHLKRCIERNPRFDYLRDLVAGVQESAEADKPDAERKKAPAQQAGKRKRPAAPKEPRKGKKPATAAAASAAVKAEDRASAQAGELPAAAAAADPLGADFDGANFGDGSAAASAAPAPAASDAIFAGMASSSVGGGAAAVGNDNDDDYD